MNAVFDWAKAHVLAWTTSAAVTLGMVRMFTPNFMDFIIDILTICLVWIAAKLASKN